MLMANLQVTADGWNLQIQPNKESKLMALAVLLETVSTVIVPRGADGGVAWGTEEIIAQFREKSVFKELQNGMTDLYIISKRSNLSTLRHVKKWGERAMDKTLAMARKFKWSERGEGPGCENVSERSKQQSRNASPCEKVEAKGSVQDVSKGVERERSGGHGCVSE